MRYCPHCQRFNEGKPQICHFCGRTWHIRLCPRGHENPYNAQYCGACGSADLTETVGPWSRFIIFLKLGLWLLIGLSIYSLLAGLLDLLKRPYRILPFVILIGLFAIGFQFALSLLPKFIGNGLRRVVGVGRKLVVMVAEWLMRRLWRY
jgi:RNA polymerase subunit RPABC4/transcription elongation factor Spt4